MIRELDKSQQRAYLELVRAQHESLAAHEAAHRKRSALVKSVRWALSEGVPAKVVADELGITVGRVYQLKAQR